MVGKTLVAPLVHQQQASAVGLRFGSGGALVLSFSSGFVGSSHDWTQSKVQPAAMSKGGIYIPSSASQQTGCQMAKVVAVAPPKPSGNVVVSEDWSKLQVGQTVMVPEFGGIKVQLEDEELFVFRGEDILAVVKDKQ